MGRGVLSYDFSKFRKTESPVFSARQVDRYDDHRHIRDFIDAGYFSGRYFYSRREVLLLLLRF